MIEDELRMIAWEITRSCNLSCLHCRASAEKGPYKNELSTTECLSLIGDIASFSNPIIILTGGEPLLREDIFEIASYGKKKGLRMVMGTNGTLVNNSNANKIVESGIARISISIDGATQKLHDQFRQVEGAFAGAMNGINFAKSVGMEFQINTTVTQDNLDQIEGILNLAIKLGAVAHHIFLLVPTGRGRELKEQILSPEDCEKTLRWFYTQKDKVPLQLKATCAPHYYRILRQEAKKEGKLVTPRTYGLDAMTRGCLGGTSFCFISHTGEVQPCGYLEINCGNVREESLESLWKNSKVFNDLRDVSNLKGKCGQCEFRTVCGGCRARAYEVYGDYLAEEPCCIYQPGSKSG
jgi:heme b synthase